MQCCVRLGVSIYYNHTIEYWKCQLLGNANETLIFSSLFLLFFFSSHLPTHGRNLMEGLVIDLLSYLQDPFPPRLAPLLFVVSHTVIVSAVQEIC